MNAMVRDFAIIQHATVLTVGSKVVMAKETKLFLETTKSLATVRSVSSSSTGWTLLWGDFTTFMIPSSSHP